MNDRLVVTMRYNPKTGEMEQFVVEMPEADARLTDHDERHEEIAVELGRFVDNLPVVVRQADATGPGTIRTRDGEEAVQPRVTESPRQDLERE